MWFLPAAIGLVSIVFYFKFIDKQYGFWAWICMLIALVSFIITIISLLMGWW